MRAQSGRAGGRRARVARRRRRKYARSLCVLVLRRSSDAWSLADERARVGARSTGRAPHACMTLACGHTSSPRSRSPCENSPRSFRCPGGPPRGRCQNVEVRLRTSRARERRTRGSRARPADQQPGLRMGGGAQWSSSPL
eukprot:8934121-Alexandrium_andersonii.AAC.1